VTIESRADSGTVALTGTVQAQTEINQSFCIDGRLIECTVGIGNTVKPGHWQSAPLEPAAEIGQGVTLRANRVPCLPLAQELRRKGLNVGGQRPSAGLSSGRGCCTAAGDCHRDRRDDQVPLDEVERILIRVIKK